MLNFPSSGSSVEVISTLTGLVGSAATTTLAGVPLISCSYGCSRLRRVGSGDALIVLLVAPVTPGLGRSICGQLLRALDVKPEYWPEAKSTRRPVKKRSPCDHQRNRARVAHPRRGR